VTHRGPEDIMDEFAMRNAESAEVLPPAKHQCVSTKLTKMEFRTVTANDFPLRSDSKRPGPSVGLAGPAIGEGCGWHAAMRLGQLGKFGV